MVLANEPRSEPIWPPLTWPAADFSRVPYRVFRDREIYDLEQERLFRGPNWCYLGLEAELPNPGDFKTSFVGEMPVVVNRDENGAINAFLNSCAHRGALVVRRNKGNAASFACAYHQWCFDARGDLIGVPQRRGVNGKGGMSKDFEMGDHSLIKLNVATYRGIVFGTFAGEIAPLEDYLGPKIRKEIDRIFSRRLKILGYYRQRIPANWKLYLENVKDPYHAGLLHLFHVTFGIYRPTMVGGAFMDDERTGHSFLKSASVDNDKETLAQAYKGIDKLREGYKLRDPSILNVKPDYDDRVMNMILTVFPNLMVGQVANTFHTRHVRPKGPDLFELYWTCFAFEDNDAEAVFGKLLQSNFIGPAGYISLEDGEAGRLVQNAIRIGDRDRSSVIEMGGRGKIEDTDYLATEVAIRGFWKHYHKMMGFDPPQAGDPAGERS